MEVIRTLIAHVWSGMYFKGGSEEQLNCYTYQMIF